MSVIDEIVIIDEANRRLQIDRVNDKILDEIIVNDESYHFAKQKDLEGVTEVVTDNAVQEPIIRLEIEGDTIQPTRNFIPLFDMNWHVAEETGTSDETLVSYYIDIPSDIDFTSTADITFSVKQIGTKVDDLFVSLTSGGSWFSGTYSYSFVQFGDIIPINSSEIYEYPFPDAIYVNKADGSDFDITEFTDNYQLVITQPCDDEYPPMPNIPADIINVGDDFVEIEVRGNNIFNHYDCNFYSTVTTVINDNSENIYYIANNRSGNNYCAADSAFLKLKPNTAYTSRVTITLTDLGSTDLGAAGSMAASLMMQANDSFDLTSLNKFYIVNGYNNTLSPDYRISTKADGIPRVVITQFTTPSNLSDLSYIATRLANYTEITFKDLMIVEGTYTEETFPEYEPYFEPQKITIPAGEFRLPKIDDTADYLLIDRTTNSVKYVQNIGFHEFDGNERIVRSGVGTDNVYRYYIESVRLDGDYKYTYGEGYCTHLTRLSAAEDKEGFLIGFNNTFPYFFLNKTDFKTVSDVKTWLENQKTRGAPVQLYWKLKQPILHDITGSPLSDQLLTLTTNKGTNILTITSNLPVSKTNLAYWRQIIPNEPLESEI